MVGELSQLHEDFQSYANWESKYFTIVGYVTEDHIIFHKNRKLLTEGIQENWTDSCHSTYLVQWSPGVH